MPISRILSRAIIYLDWLLPTNSSCQPVRSSSRVNTDLSGIAPREVYQADVLPRRWWALTSPFHPCLLHAQPADLIGLYSHFRRRFRAVQTSLRVIYPSGCVSRGGLRFYDTISRITPGGRYPSRCSAVSGLSSVLSRPRLPSIPLREILSLFDI